jgi:carboxypeptidase C (cathepsin A)
LIPLQNDLQTIPQLTAFAGMILPAGATAAAWKTKLSWYLLTTEDHMIAPELQRFMSKRANSKVVEVKGSHAVYVSKPEAVASIIEQAAAGSTITK